MPISIRLYSRLGKRNGVMSIPVIESTRAARRALHRVPELSGEERGTAEQIAQWLSAYHPEQLLTGIGGYGVMAVFGKSEAQKILLRCELDALPIQETNNFEYRSEHTGIAHKCGHDGHMAILLEVARRLQQQPMDDAQVMLLFQPAEETGTGAAAVCRDEKFQALQPDYAFALHNMPGYPMGSVVLRQGTMNCASRGVIVTLTGKTAHAAQPETGRSPAPVMTALIDSLAEFSGRFGKNGLALATVVGAQLGAKAFGTAPGSAELYVTLRSQTDEIMQAMLAEIELQLTQLCAQYELSFAIAFEDVFPAVNNTVEGITVVAAAAESAGAELIQLSQPIRWSEDFGHIINTCQGALFGLGAGERHAALHNPDYDFPDELIDHGAGVFMEILRQCNR